MQVNHKIKTNDNRANFFENKQNSEQLDSETSKLQPVKDLLSKFVCHLAFSFLSPLMDPFLIWY